MVGITHGDVNGVGYEVILKIFSEPAMLELCTPIIYGSPKVATYHRKALELTTNFVTIQKADDVVDGLFSAVREELPGLLREDPANGSQALDFLMIAKYFERIGDHAVNIAEWVVYAITGVHRTAEENKEDV